MNNTPPIITDEPDEVVELRFITYQIVLPIIVAAGILLNSLGLVAFSINSKNATHSYLVSLASSNLAVMILSIPLLIHTSDPWSCRSWPEAWYQAYCELPLMNTAVAFSVYMLVCVSVERYVSVCQPGSFHRIHRKSVARVAISIALVSALVTQAPLAITQQIVWVSDESNFTCRGWIVFEHSHMVSSPYWIAYLWASQVLSRFAPCTALAILNLKMICKFRRVIFKRNQMTTNAVSASQSNTPSSSNLNITAVKKRSSSAVANQDETRLLALLIVMVLLFVMCIIPAGVVPLQYSQSREEDFQFQLFRAVANGLELLNLAVICFLLCLCNSEIQLWMAGFLVCCRTGCTVTESDHD